MSSEGSYSGPIDNSDLLRRFSLDDRVAAAIAVDRVKDEEAVARSGDSGVKDDRQDHDPWFSGQMEQMETKWLEQRLRHRLRPQSQVASAEDRDIEHAQEGASLRFGRAQSLKRWGSVHSAPSFWHTRSLRHSLRGSIDVPIEEFLQLRAYSDTSTVQLAGSGPEMDEKERSPDAGKDPSLLSDNASIPETFLDTNGVDVANSSSGEAIHQSQSREVNRFHHSLEYACSLAHLAFFGMIGVLIRYGLEVLFADDLGVTHDGTDLYIDLPANMVGSFFMGWVGIVFKRDISLFSEPLAIGFSTGLMGSITTFAGWNQKMVSLVTNGNVAAALAGFLLGMELAQVSLAAGVDTATAFKGAISQIQQHRVKKGLEVISRPSPHNFHQRMVSFAIFSCISVFLWATAAVLMVKSGSSQKHKTLWLACMVGPPGVWARWHLARLNGRGLGTHLKWLPLGTLLANLIAASLEAVLAILLDVVVHNNAPLLIGGFQFGFLGCMSTVSTFVAEIYSMRTGLMKFKSYVYMFGTCLPALLLGILFYSVPAWAKGYVKW